MSETTPAPAKRGRKPKTAAVAESAPVEAVSIQEARIGELDSNVIAAPQKAHTDGPVRSNTAVTAAGVIGSVAADNHLKNEKAPVVEEKDDKNKVALWSDKNIRWTGVGTLNKGYNIVNKEAADAWLARQGIRKATPEEVAAHYGR